MTEHLKIDGDFTRATSSENEQLQSIETVSRAETALSLGDRALSNTKLYNAVEKIESSGTFDKQVKAGGIENMTINNEGMLNAELFKSRYDTVAESINDALQGNATELKDKLPAILQTIDALLAAPYISSAPEFVAMVKAAKSSIEATESISTLDDEAFVSHLVQAKQHLAGTLIAYRPQS